MALTFPLAWPEPARIASLTFELSRVQAVSQTRGGIIQASERGRSLWQFEVMTTPLDVDTFETFRAFLSALRGQMNTFTFQDVTRFYPRAYPNGWAGVQRADGSDFNGTATITEASGYFLSLSNLPSGYQAKAGDMVAWNWGNTRTLHRIVEDRMATAGGILTDVQVEPDIPPGGGATGSARLSNAWAVFRLASPAPEPRRGIAAGDPITIRGIQYLA